MLVVFFVLTILSNTSFVSADTATPTPDPSTNTQPVTQQYGNTKLLEIHKPMIPTAWGRVLQYKKEVNFALASHNQETLYEFVLQNNDGIIRTATYHETPDGDGYWEVYVWDQL
jgi:hypothetical protein